MVWYGLDASRPKTRDSHGKEIIDIREFAERHDSFRLVNI